MSKFRLGCLIAGILLIVFAGVAYAVVWNGNQISVEPSEKIPVSVSVEVPQPTETPIQVSTPEPVPAETPTSTPEPISSTSTSTPTQTIPIETSVETPTPILTETPTIPKSTSPPIPPETPASTPVPDETPKPATQPVPTPPLTEKPPSPPEQTIAPLIPEPTPRPDSDGDGMSDWFEENIVHSSPEIPNERYFIYIYAIEIKPHYMGFNCTDGICEKYIDMNKEAYIAPFAPIRTDGSHWSECRYILRENKFKPENIIQLIGKEATAENFKKAVLEIAKRADKNDLVYVQLSGHGVIGQFYFFELKRTSHEEIDRIIDNIEAKAVVVAIEACYSGVSIGPLMEGPCPRVVMASREMLWYSGVASGLWKKVLAEKIDGMDLDKNSYLSIKEGWLADTKGSYEIMRRKSINRMLTEEIEEGWNYTLTKGEGGTLFCEISHKDKGCWHYAFSDPDNIGTEIYLGDASVEELKD